MGRRKDVQKVVMLGANGAMGAGCGQVFAQAGIPTVFLARTVEKAEAGRAKAVKRAKNEALASQISVGSYDADLERSLIDADLILECVSEDLAVKRALFEQIDAHRPEGSVVATVSSGLSIAGLCAGRSETFRRHFVGIHFFNPPHVITGCELVPHDETDPELVGELAVFLHHKLHRELIVTADTPAFCGNRIGFKVLNECAQLAGEYGAAYIDHLMGPHTGRAMAPLATVDFVGWDVHRAIVDNLHSNTKDEANSAFAIPEFMQELIKQGHLGDKTAAKGGFFRKAGDGKGAPRLALDPKKGEYVMPGDKIPVIAQQMTDLHIAGRHMDAFDLFAEANGDTGLLRKVVLGYISYALSRVGEVVERTEDVDRIMAHGFRWAPPGLLVDLIGAARTVRLLEAAKLPVPQVIVTAAEENQPLHDPAHEISRYFPGPVTTK